MRMMLIISSLALGGAERVAATLVNYWINSGHEVTLVTIDSSERDFFQVQANVQRIALDLAQASNGWLEFIRNNYRRVKGLRALLRTCRPDVIVSFLDTTNILVLIAALGLKLPVVISGRTDPRRHSIGVVNTMLRRLVYPLARALVVQTRDVGQWAKGIVRKDAVYVIPNPIRENSAAGGNVTKDGNTVLAIGRMEAYKGFDLLLAAFARCAGRFPGWRLRLIGDGPLRKSLEALARELCVSDRVQFDGFVNGPDEALRRADLFVLSSRYEGFPNVLLEAMACGLPVISFDCPSGPAEIIRAGVDGILVSPGNVEGLADAMERLMRDETERMSMGSRAAEVAERFSLPAVMTMWGDVLQKAVMENREG